MQHVPNMRLRATTFPQKYDVEKVALNHHCPSVRPKLLLLFLLRVLVGYQVAGIPMRIWMERWSDGSNLPPRSM